MNALPSMIALHRPKDELLSLGSVVDGQDGHRRQQFNPRRTLSPEIAKHECFQPSTGRASRTVRLLDDETQFRPSATPLMGTVLRYCVKEAVLRVVNYATVSQLQSVGGDRCRRRPLIGPFRCAKRTP